MFSLAPFALMTSTYIYPIHCEDNSLIQLFLLNALTLFAMQHTLSTFLELTTRQIFANRTA